MLQGLEINYRGKSYRVQNVNGWQHIIVTNKGKRQRIGVSQIQKEKDEENDCVYNYIFGGGFTQYKCPAMEYWIYRHRLGNKISVKNYAIKFGIKKKTMAY